MDHYKYQQHDGKICIQEFRGKEREREMASIGETVEYDRIKHMKAFDESKSCVKSLVDGGITEIPRMFVRPQEHLDRDLPIDNTFDTSALVIDLGLDTTKTHSPTRSDIVESVRKAVETVGFFQVVNHGIPTDLMQEVFGAVRKFHEQPNEEKMKIHSRELNRRVKFHTNLLFYTLKYANWRDTLTCIMGRKNLDGPLDQLPAIVSNPLLEYSKHLEKLEATLYEILSEALGLKANHLNNMALGGAHTHNMHYYPATPEPDRTMFFGGHTDPDFLTILLQDDIGGLQVLCDNKWVDISPIDGALVVNVGDLLQVVSNGKFRSAIHRVVAKDKGRARISVATFCKYNDIPNTYGPIKELISDDNPPIYKDVIGNDYVSYFLYEAALKGIPALKHFELPNLNL